MGCTASQNVETVKDGTQIKASSTPTTRAPFLMKQPYKGEMTPFCKECLDGEAGGYAEIPEGDPLLPPEGIPEMRAQMDEFGPVEAEKWKKYTELCEITEYKYTNSAGEETKFFDVRNKTNVGKKGLPAFIDFHGGGAYMGKPEEDFGLCSRLALLVDVVFFTCAYRLGPEVKAPTGGMDAKCAIEQIYARAEEFGIDNTRVSTMGSSGGGWINLLATTFVAREGKIKLKSMYLLSPMLDNTVARREFQDWEKFSQRFVNEDYKLHATDFEKQDKENDFNLFPGRISQEDAKKLPPVILQKSEFDMLRGDTDEIIPKLQQAGVYADHMDFAGVAHCFYLFADEPNADMFYEQQVAAMKAYSGVQ